MYIKQLIEVTVAPIQIIVATCKKITHLLT
jgi:hypothetical protein